MSSTLATLPDEVLLSELHDESGEAFDLLVSRYKDRLTNCAHWLLGEREEVYPLVQEVFLKLYFAGVAARHIRSLSPWFHGQILRTARGRLRRRRWQAALRSVLKNDPRDPSVSSGQSSWQTPEPESPPPPGSIVQDRLQIFPDKLKEALVLCEIQGLSYEEVSSILRVPPTAVASRAQKARAVFCELVKMEGENQR